MPFPLFHIADVWVEVNDLELISPGPIENPTEVG